MACIATTFVGLNHKTRAADSPLGEPDSDGPRDAKGAHKTDEEGEQTGARELVLNGSANQESDKLNCEGGEHIRRK
jgi:hypothetical protein